VSADDELDALIRRDLAGVDTWRAHYNRVRQHELLRARREPSRNPVVVPHQEPPSLAVVAHLAGLSPDLKPCYIHQKKLTKDGTKLRCARCGKEWWNTQPEAN
jgi:hypothetical protein